MPQIPVGGIGLGSSSGGEGEDGVDGGFEGSGVALDLREEKSALQRSEKRHSEVVGADSAGRCPAV
jgi:hypothetical protein